MLFNYLVKSIWKQELIYVSCARRGIRKGQKDEGASYVWVVCSTCITTFAKKAFKPVPTRLFGGLAYLLVALAGLISIGVFELNVWANLGIAIVLGLCFASLGF